MSRISDKVDFVGYTIKTLGFFRYSEIKIPRTNDFNLILRLRQGTG